MRRPQRKILKKRSRKGARDRGALDLIEEAISFLRVNPSVLLSYIIGSFPFMLALLYFWSDMIRSPFAAQHVAETSLGLAVLFFWMKSWQAVFVQQVLACVRAVPAPHWPFKRIRRLVATQIIFHAWGFIFLPAALIITMPFPWLYAFYQNISVYGHGGEAHSGIVRKHAWRQAKLWPKQNMIVIWLLSPWLLVLAAILIVVGLPLIGSLENQGLLFGLMALLVLVTIPLNPIGMVIALNLAGALMMLPWLAKTLLGIETVFTLSAMSAVNTTFAAIVCALAYLCLDPLIKVVYALRCFYGESIQTGEDLKVALRTVSRQTVLVVCAVGLMGMMGMMGGVSRVLAQDWRELTPLSGVGFLLSLPERELGFPSWEGLGWVSDTDVLSDSATHPLPLPGEELSGFAAKNLPLKSLYSTTVQAQESAGEAALNPETSSTPVSAQELEESLKHVLNRAEYSWRLPREKISAEDLAERELHPAVQWIADAIDGIGETLRNWGKTVKRWGRKVRDWWTNIFPQSSPDSRRSRRGGDWMPGVQTLVFILLAAIVSVLAVLLWRFVKQRRQLEKAVVVEETAARPDLTKDDVDARDLPEDGWLAMARDLLEKGQMRLALRALYLATLACLAERELITIARFKSDRDYYGELDRRAHALPDLPPVFAENMLTFQQVWYGMHTVDRATVDHFTANYRKLKMSVS